MSEIEWLDPMPIVERPMSPDEQRICDEACDCGCQADEGADCD